MTFTEQEAEKRRKAFDAWFGPRALGFIGAEDEYWECWKAACDWQYYELARQVTPEEYQASFLSKLLGMR